MNNKIETLSNKNKFSNRIRVQQEHLKQQESHYKNVLAGRWNQVIASPINKYIPFIELGYRIIITDNVQTNLLSQKMNKCNEGIKCGSPGCPKCFNEYRKNMQVSLSKMNRNNNIKIITILLPDNMMTDKQFLKHDPNILKEVLRQHLVNAEIHSSIHGQLSYYYHANSGLWLPVFMLIYFKFDSGQLRALNRSLLGEGNTSAPMHVKTLKLHDKIPFFPDINYSQLVLTNVNGKKKPRRIRLKAKKIIIALRVYQRIGFESIKFSYHAGKA